MESKYTAQCTTPLPDGKGCLKLRQNSSEKHIYCKKLRWLHVLFVYGCHTIQFIFYLSRLFYEKGDRRGIDTIFLLKAQII